MLKIFRNGKRFLEFRALHNPGIHGFFLPFVCGSVPGLIDWLSLKDHKVVKITNWHARLNVIALLIFALSFYLRTTSGANLVSRGYNIALALSVLGVILISISGYLGVEMVFKHAVAVEGQSRDRTA